MGYREKILSPVIACNLGENINISSTVCAKCILQVLCTIVNQWK